jgi:7-cyano-7-deazaguanine synthase
VLLMDEAAAGEVQPLYVRVGLAWERAEREAIARFIEAAALGSRVRPLAVQGQPPGYHTPDEDVYLPGRNVILFGKAAVFCAAAGIGRMVIGTLDHNPFPDATPAFRAAMQTALSLGLAHTISIEAPYATRRKADVICRGAELGAPIAATLSCMKPTEGLMHCGLCSKCRERHLAFVEAGVADPTTYADQKFVRSG